MEQREGELVYAYARSGDVEGLRSLGDPTLRRLANWRHAKNHQQTPLWTASKYCRHTAVHLLLQMGADPRLEDAQLQYQPIHIACSEGGSSLVVQELLTSDPTLVNDCTRIGNFSPLYLASMNGRTPLVRLLLQNGANPKTRDVNGCTALMAATLGNHTEILNELLLRDVNIEESNSQGWTALHFAAASQKMESLHWLLVNGANGGRETKDKKIPLDIALDYGNRQAEMMLKNPPKMSGLPSWRPSVHTMYPIAFQQQAKLLLVLMVRLRKGPLREMHRDICKIMIRELAELYRFGNGAREEEESDSKTPDPKDSGCLI